MIDATPTNDQIEAATQAIVKNLNVLAAAGLNKMQVARLLTNAWDLAEKTAQLAKSALPPSSAVEPVAVNDKVPGSNPGGAASG